MKYRTWGKYQQQTVKKDKDVVGAVIIRQDKSFIYLDGNEIDSIVIALLEMRK